ncbi:iron-sulfur cluster assembly accessory protein [Photobacterium damselae]|uniref:iron-sulfur cluster assembly accessory protein n=1 Tax=Photobacterium damselae TaxID=38293 RepID=UPI0011D12ED4|nr:iron-sulfur cluster assembly accessory protein [Photobacterium damselae]KAB1505926.1 iron-sulfur cluster assembly accessory protein [Photobacterium damselae subsp. damselae]
MSNNKISVTEFNFADITWKGITVTPAAAERIISLSKNNKAVRFSVKMSGCTGYAYVIEQLTVIEEQDVSFNSHGALFYVALSAMPVLDGTEIDFVKQGLNQSFVYHNPNVKTECGCGESFGI